MRSTMSCSNSLCFKKKQTFHCKLRPTYNICHILPLHGVHGQWPFHILNEKNSEHYAVD